MKDNDIIKALEICAEDTCGMCSADCPMIHHTPMDWDECKRAIMGEALDLINRQKAENEKLQKQLDSKCERCIARDRTEAIKEFAERLKEKLDWTTEPLDEYDIDELVKEMTEDTKFCPNCGAKMDGGT